jgi:ATP-dependent protease ClpP protease subunit
MFTVTSVQAQLPCIEFYDEKGKENFSPEVIEIRLDREIGYAMESKLIEIIDQYIGVHPTVKVIKIHISSHGGFNDSGFKIHNYLRGLHEELGFQIVTHNTHQVASAAVLVYCAGKERITSPHSFFMVHDSFHQLNQGDYTIKDIRDFDEENAITSAAAYDVFSKCTTLPIAEVRPLFAQQTYIDVDRALELRLAHAVQLSTFDPSADVRCVIDGGEPPAE